MGKLQIPTLLLYIATYVYAIPVSNETHEEPLTEPAWGPEPKGRGTFSIILSSVITLTICVWTSLHINVMPNATTRQRVLNKLKYVIVGVFAPEYILFLALRQLAAAKEFQKKWSQIPWPKDDNHSLEDRSPSLEDRNPLLGGRNPSVRDRNPLLEGGNTLPGDEGTLPKDEKNTLSIEEAFFACMGGFSLRVFPEAGLFRNTLTPNGLLYLKKQGLISKNTLNKKMIMDKGKADILAKSLVCVQAFWMVAQCAVRKASGLPVTLLELHVVMHVLCTVIVYACWMSKPLDVAEPIALIQDPDLASLLLVNYGAYGNLKFEYPGATKGSGDIAESTPDSTKPTSPPGEGGLFLFEVGKGTPTRLSQSTSKLHFLKREDQTIHVKRGLFGRTCILTESEFLGELPLNEAMISAGSSLMIDSDILVHQIPSKVSNSTTPMSSTEIEILFSAAAALRMGEHTQYLAQPMNYSLLCHQVPGGEYGGSSLDSHIWMAIVVSLPLIYGACHAAAWDTHFPTPIECWLWRISSIIVGAIPSLTALLAISKDTHSTIGKLPYKCVYGWWEDSMDWAYNKLQPPWDTLPELCQVAPPAVLALVLFFARFFLIVESFLSLRSLPIGSFSTTPWDDYWPHF